MPASPAATKTASPSEKPSFLNNIKTRFASPSRSPSQQGSVGSHGNSAASTPTVGSPSSPWKLPNYSHSKRKRERIRELEERVQAFQLKLGQFEDVKEQLQEEQQRATEWQQHWNYQNFKSELLVDMLVCRIIESEHQTAERHPVL